MKNIRLKVVPAVEEVPFPPEVMRSRTDRILLLFVTVFMPGETFLIEGYNYLWALMIGLLGKHEISLLRVFPARTTTKKVNNDCVDCMILYSHMHARSFRLKKFPKLADNISLTQLHVIRYKLSTQSRDFDCFDGCVTL